MSRKMITADGNTVVGYVAHATNEVIAIYPITPSSGMGEVADERSAKGLKNIWGTIPLVAEMQSEGGAAGAVHGALATGALSTTFTCSQGLLLMIPNMYKIAGELTPTVFHVAARSLASHALSIFNDHGDVMACRQTGFAMLSSASVQEAMDFALIAQAATLEARVPILHFFDGFRTTHEVAKVEELTFDDMRAMLDQETIEAHRRRSLSPDHPTIKGTAQNPDVFFQAREASNPYYNAVPAIVQKCMDRFAKIVGRQYHLYEYFGAPDAERVIIAMASSTETIHETVDYLNKKGEKVGVLKVRLFRPFDAETLVKTLPKTVKSIAVLDRTKEPGAMGEPLYIDVRSAVGEVLEAGKAPFEKYPVIIGGRYGLGSKDFTPPMVKAVFDNLAAKAPKNHFTVGIDDDVTGKSISYDPSFSIAADEAKVYSAMFYGLGSDGTVGANKNTIKIIGEHTSNYAQGYFVYDSRKAGTITTSHVRFGPSVIRKPYLIERAEFVACHNFSFLEKYDMLSNINEGGTFLLNSHFGPEEVWDKIPAEVQKQIIDKKLKFYVIDGVDLGIKLGLGSRINMIMQTAFFVISGVIPEETAIGYIKDAIYKTYSKKGEKIVQMNYNAVDESRKNVFLVKYPNVVSSSIHKPPVVPENSSEFIKKVTGSIISGNGDTLKVGDMPVDGTFPVGTTQIEKRNIAVQIPEWDPNACIQCGQCSLVCPHAAIRIKLYEPAILEKAPKAYKSVDAKGPQFKGKKFTVQVAPEDCTGCSLCIKACPVKQKNEAGELTGRKAINLVTQFTVREQEKANFEFFLSIPETDSSMINRSTVKGSQLLKPLFEFSGACAGCGETPYVKLVTQLFGDRSVIANATGCSSIYGGNLPTTPYTTRADGRGPAWANSLFEDNAEFGFGYRLTFDKFNEYATEMLTSLAEEGVVDKTLAGKILSQDQTTQEGIEIQRANVEELKKSIGKDAGEKTLRLKSMADYLVHKDVWVFGGDGWAYDIGYGGLDHVIASGKNINILVLDTEVYSNTGGQMSKSTPRGATAKFAASGKQMGKKDLGMMAMNYGNVYVAKIAIGADMNHAVKAINEAASYDGPSLIIAYSHCINHGIDMINGLDQQKKAVDSGHWILFRFDPRRAAQGKNPLQIDSKEPSIPIVDYIFTENRYASLKKSDPERAKILSDMAQEDIKRMHRIYKGMAAISYEDEKKE